jgi:hypothetical protein
MTVQARPYLYENGLYVTPRQLRERFGTSSLVDLHAQYPGRFEQSRVRLLESIIYCCSVNGETKVVPVQERRRLHRWSERRADLYWTEIAQGAVPRADDQALD